jgi:hypothetical protein
MVFTFIILFLEMLKILNIFFQRKKIVKEK